MSRLSSAFIQAVKASLDLGLVRMTGPPLTDETIEAAKQGDAAAFEEMMAWYEPISLNQREEHDVIKEILSTAGLNETADNPPVVATGEKSNHVVTTDRLPRFLSMARHGRMAATIIEPPTPYPVELICADSPVTPVESNLIVALVRWDDVEGFGEADLTRLLARIKGKLEATWSLFDGDDYAHKNPASGELKIVLLGRVGDATVSLTMKDGRLQHSLRDEDLPILGSASRILLLDEKAWAIDVQSVLYLVHRTTADIIWLHGDKDEPGHKVFRAQTLRDMLRETAAVNVQEVLPFLAVADMIEHQELMHSHMPPDAKWVSGLLLDALRTIQASEPSPEGDSTVKLWPPVAIDGPHKTEKSISVTYVTRVAGSDGGGSGSSA